MKIIKTTYEGKPVNITLTKSLGLPGKMTLETTASLLLGWAIGASITNFQLDPFPFKPVRVRGTKCFIKAIGRTCVLDVGDKLPVLMQEAAAFLHTYNHVIPFDHVDRQGLVNEAFNMALKSVVPLPLTWVSQKTEATITA